MALLLLLALSCAVEHNGVGNDGQCKYKKSLEPRPHSVSILEFGAVGDGKTSNTIAFENAIFYLKSFADKGGAQLYVPPGRWLTGSFNLTSHLTLFLERGATILGSQVLVSNLMHTHCTSGDWKNKTETAKLFPLSYMENHTNQCKTSKFSRALLTVGVRILFIGYGHPCSWFENHFPFCKIDPSFHPFIRMEPFLFELLDFPSSSLSHPHNFT